MTSEKNKFQKLLRRAKEGYTALPSGRTPECPSDEDLRSLCYEENEGPLREKYMDHMLVCRYCMSFIHREVQVSIERKKALDAKEDLFPLAAEIDWKSITTVELLGDRLRVAKKKAANRLVALELEISGPGFYYLVIDSGQVLWRRDIEAGEIQLSDKEREQAMDYGMAASKDFETGGIVGFEEECWEGRLRVKLVKRVDGALLVIELTDI